MRVQRRFKPFWLIRALRTRKNTSWLLLCGLAFALPLRPRLARAQPSAVVAPATLSVSSGGGSECPAPRVVEQAVLRLIPSERYPLLIEHAVRVELDDLDKSYRVRVFKDGAPTEKTYTDPARDCAGRANFAAVFAALVVMPPELGFGALPEPEPKSKPKPKPAMPARIVPKLEPKLELALTHRPPLAQLELSGVIAFAPAILDAPELTSLGGELRVALGRGTFAGTFSAGYLARAKFELGDVRGDVARLPVSVGLRLRSEFASWQLSGDFGALAVSQRVRATNLVSARSLDTLELALRAGVQLSSLGYARFRPFVGAFAWVSPGPRELAALPNGVLGNLPYLWLGGALGVSLGL